MSEGLPAIEEWGDYNDNRMGADPMKADINSLYDKASTLPTV
jgi:hypothetical protein